MQVGTYPTRNFALVSPYVAIGLGPYLQLTRRTELVGVWPLRIPRNNLTGELPYPTAHRLLPRSFLLIVRTGRIVTEQAQYRRILGVSSI